MKTSKIFKKLIHKFTDKSMSGSLPATLLDMRFKWTFLVYLQETRLLGSRLWHYRYYMIPLVYTLPLSWNSLLLHNQY